MLERGTALSQSDPGVHYQLFIAYSRLKRKADADRELAIFKRLEEARKSEQDAQDATSANKPDDAPLPDPTVTKKEPPAQKPPPIDR
jgi:hypothetical protein